MAAYLVIDQLLNELEEMDAQPVATHDRAGLKSSRGADLANMEPVMPSRRKKPTELSSLEQQRFLDASTELHRAIVTPLIAPQSEHYQALQRVHAALLRGIEEVTGAPAPWSRQSSS